ncbi:hypothetical protein J22TS1_15500 [Siminovitchia terrae]|nr:hypothetical protein J22TS1_15500 [Siminovitchia terrae]
MMRFIYDGTFLFAQICMRSSSPIILQYHLIIYVFAILFCLSLIIAASDLKKLPLFFIAFTLILLSLTKLTVTEQKQEESIDFYVIENDDLH